MPRGSKFEIRPGKTIITNGNPQEIMMPFKFGNLDQVSFTQAESLQRMVQMATGAVDAAGIPGSINGEAAAGAVSMSLGAIIKRHKRTLINFKTPSSFRWLARLLGVICSMTQTISLHKTTSL